MIMIMADVKCRKVDKEYQSNQSNNIRLIHLAIPKHCIVVIALMQQFNSTQQLKVVSKISMQMAQVLNKMAKFFNQMTEQCLLQLSDNQAIKYKHRLLLNRQNLKNFENTKKLQKLKVAKEKEEEKEKKKQNAIQKMKSLKPKHPVSSFFCFYREKGQQIAKEKGEILGSKIAKIVGQLWKSMSEEQREPYQKISRQTRHRYEEQMTKYRLKYADEIQKLKKYKKEIKQKKKAPQQKESNIEKKDQVKKEYLPQQHKEQEQNLFVEEGPSGGQSEEDSLLQLSDGLSNSLSIKSKEQSQKSQQNNEQDDLDPQIKEMMRETSLKDELENHAAQNVIGSLDIKIMEQSCPIENKGQDSKQPNKAINNSGEKQSKIQDEERKSNNSESQINFKESQLQVAFQETNQPSNEIDYENIKRPKGPISSFFIFYRSEGKRLSEQYDIPLGPKVIRLASQIWRKMAKEQKLSYELLSKQTRDNYYTQMQQVKQTYGQNVFERLKLLRGSKKEIKVKKPRGKKARK